MDKTKQMAEAILNGPNESYQLMTQRVVNASAAVGKMFAPTMVFAAGVIGGFAGKIAAMMEQFPLLSNALAIVVTGLIAFRMATIAGRFTYAAYSDTLIFGRKVMDALTLSNIKANAVMLATKAQTAAATVATWALTAAQRAQAVGMGIVTVATWAFNAALWANPITWVVAAIVALIAVVVALVKYWEPISGFFIDLWDDIKGAFSVAWDLITAILSYTPIGLVIKAWSPVYEFFSGLWDGVKSLFAGAWDYISDVLLSPIAAVKETLGGLWDQLFGDGEKTVTVNQISSGGSAPEVGSVSAGGVTVANVGGIPAASAVPQSAPITNDYSGMVIQAAPGMDEQALAREVRRQLDDRDRAAARDHRSRLYD
jgi:hypothetical protein